MGRMLLDDQAIEDITNPKSKPPDLENLGVEAAKLAPRIKSLQQLTGHR
jgi:hypothetical protein